MNGLIASCRMTMILRSSSIPVARGLMADTFFRLDNKRLISLSAVEMKNFKHKPLPPPKRVMTDPEDLFGEPKGWHIPSGGYFLLIIPVSTLLLGIWQVYRWRWKLQVIDEMEKKVHALPEVFPTESLESLDHMEYQKVKLKGTFDYTREILMGPRSLYNYAVDAQPSSGGLISNQTPSNTGYHVVTPFRIEDKNMTILVNRGWISERNPSKFRSVDHPIEIVAVVRKAEKRQPFMSKHTGRGFMLYRDVPLMARTLDTEEVFLDLVSISGIDLSSARLHSLPVPNQTRVTLRNEHVSYFCTWFSLSAITSFMWYKRFILKQSLR